MTHMTTCTKYLIGSECIVGRPDCGKCEISSLGITWYVLMSVCSIDIFSSNNFKTPGLDLKCSKRKIAFKSPSQRLRHILVGLFVCLLLMILLMELGKFPFGISLQAGMYVLKSGVQTSLNWETSLLQTKFNVCWDRRHICYHHYDILTHSFG